MGAQCARGPEPLTFNLLGKVQAGAQGDGLVEYFAGEYLRGQLYHGDEYVYKEGEESEKLFLEHLDTGIRVTDMVLDFRAAAPGQPFCVLFHYTGTKALASFSNRGKKEVEKLADLEQLEPQFGRGLYVSVTEPALLIIDESTIPSKDELEVCIPVLVPQRFVKRLSVESNAYLSQPGEDVRIVQLSKQARAASLKAAFDAKIAISWCRIQNDEAANGPTHPDTLSSMNEHAEMLSALGKLAEAEKLHRRTLSGREATLGLTHPETLASLNNLGLLLYDAGQFEEAERAHRRALEGREAELGPLHFKTLASLNNLALVLERMKKPEEAELLHRQALEGRESTLGSAHPDTLQSLNNLAALAQAQGLLAEAEVMHRRALQGREEVFGPNHHTTVNSMNNLAIVLFEQGRLKEAADLQRKAMEGREVALGPTHPNTLKLLTALASTLVRLNEFDEAEKLLRRALAEREASLGPTDPMTIASLEKLAGVMRKAERYEEAERLFRLLLSRTRTAGGPGSRDTLAATASLAAVLEAAGKPKDAETHRRTVLRLRQQNLGERHPETLEAMYRLACLHEVLGRTSEALRLYRQVQSLREEVLGVLHADTQETSHRLVRLLMSLGQTQEAEELTNLFRAKRMSAESRGDLAAPAHHWGSSPQALRSRPYTYSHRGPPRTGQAYRKLPEVLQGPALRGGLKYIRGFTAKRHLNEAPEAKEPRLATEDDRARKLYWFFDDDMITVSEELGLSGFCQVLAIDALWTDMDAEDGCWRRWASGDLPVVLISDGGLTMRSSHWTVALNMGSPKVHEACKVLGLCSASCPQEDGRAARELKAKLKSTCIVPRVRSGGDCGPHALYVAYVVLQKAGLLQPSTHDEHLCLKSRL